MSMRIHKDGRMCDDPNCPQEHVAARDLHVSALSEPGRTPQGGYDLSDKEVLEVMKQSFGEDDVANAFAETLVGYSTEFDEMCEQRHKAGADKYGPGKFLTVDTIEEALQELVDLANYTRYTFIKLRMLQEAILVQGEGAGVLDDQGFIKTRDATKPVKGE